MAPLKCPSSLVIPELILQRLSKYNLATQDLAASDQPLFNCCHSFGALIEKSIKSATDVVWAKGRLNRHRNSDNDFVSHGSQHNMASHFGDCFIIDITSYVLIGNDYFNY